MTSAEEEDGNEALKAPLSAPPLLDGSNNIPKNGDVPRPLRKRRQLLRVIRRIAGVLLGNWSF